MMDMILLLAQCGWDILGHFPLVGTIRGWEIYCYARELINSPRTDEPREWCQTKGAEAAKPLLWKRKRRHDNFPTMRTKIFKTSKDVIGLDWLQKLKREGEFKMTSGQGSHWLIESPTILSFMCSPPLPDICQLYF